MSTASQPSTGRGGVLEALMASVRPEFRADLLVFAADDPVFSGGVCRVAGCARNARGRGLRLCQGHYLRWRDHGRPDLDEFTASTDPRWHRQQPNRRCRVAGCGYGVARQGLCQPHACRWQRAGGPELETWLGEGPAAVRPPAPGAVCRIEHCDLWPHGKGSLCHAHTATWRANGRPDVDEFVEAFTTDRVLAEESVRLDGLGSQLRLELQYAIQQRHDQRRGKTTPHAVMRVVRRLRNEGVTSLLDDDEDGWRRWGRAAFNDSMARSFCNFAYQVVADLAEAGGWEAEYPRDVWRMHRLGFEGHRTLNFEQIPQPRLRNLAKRWVRWRLATGLGLEAGGGRPVIVLSRFARFLSTINITQPDDIDRGVLERYLGDLHAEMAGSTRHNSHVGLLNSFLAAVRLHGWDTSLPSGAQIFTEDYPKRREQLPRALAEQVMTQLEHHDNLDRFTNRSYRLVTMILMRCGLRVTDALRLPADCVVTDSDGAPYLRYLNHKMKREALVPIDADLHEQITTQQRAVAPAPVLFPRPTKNPDRTEPVASATYRLALYRWLERCDIRDEHGQLVRLTPHQWRHTLGTRLVNNDVPQEVVRRILDHDSPQMTAHYARLHDDTVRRHWEAARKVNATGDQVTIDPGGPLADAAWAKHRLGQATQALPNGYCGLPVQKTCPHANACLTCPMFITTNEFLPQHQAQRREVHQIITAAEARGQTRLAEMNRQVADNLDKIITGLQHDDHQGAAGAS